MAYQIGSAKSENIQSVIVNAYGDEIKINASDATLRGRYTEFIKWMDVRRKELEAECDEKEKFYGDRVAVETKEDGSVSIDAEQLSDMIDIQNRFCADVIKRIDGVFGQDIVNKYFRDDYALNPDFVPDEEQAIQFINEITDAASEIYNMRKQRIDAKYSKNRRKK